MEWIQEGAEGTAPTVRAETLGILVRPSGDFCLVCPSGEIVEYDAPFFALGAPETFLSGAMAAGATAEQAVRLAIQHTDGAAGDVQVESIELPDD